MEPGVVIGGKYHVVQLVGRGGMGAVYDAINGSTGRRVALKLIKEHDVASGSASRQRFAREVKAAGAIDSIHVVQVLDAGGDVATGVPYLVMEFLQGEDLRAVLARGPLSTETALTIAIQACRGLVKAHAADVVHRDLKPANLFLAEVDGGKRIVKILDFGVAKMMNDDDDALQELTTTGDVVGSPPYMSPEQLSSPRDVDHRTDVWSLGVVLYQMISGKLPTPKNEPIGSMIHAICHTPAPLLSISTPATPPALVDVIQRALTIDRSARFASAEQMLEALCALQSGSELEEEEVRPSSVRAAPSSAPASGATPLDLAVTEASPPRASLRWGGFAAAALATALTVSVGSRLVGRAPTDHDSSTSAPIAIVTTPAPSETPAETASAATSAPPTTSPSRAARPASSGARKGGARRGKSEDTRAAPPSGSTTTGREQL